MGQPTTASSDWERARKPEQIEERRDAILSAARHLLEQGGVDAAGLSAIAREAGLSKANLYRYFESREAILLAILIEEMQDWTEALGRSLSKLPGSGDVTAVAQEVADSLQGRDRLCKLLASLASVLEQNLSVETIASWKRELRELYVGLIPPLCHALPQFSKAQANEFWVMHALFQMGLWPHTQPSPDVEEVLGREEFADMRMDFSERIRWHSLILLRGLESVEPPRIRPQS